HRRRPDSDDIGQRPGHRDRRRRSNASVPAWIPRGIGTPSDRKRARSVLRQRDHRGARRPHVGGVARSRPGQYLPLRPPAPPGARGRSSAGASSMRSRRLIALSWALVLVTLALGPTAPPARAETVDASAKIDPALLALMQARPLSLLPVIVEMQPPAPPFTAAANVDRANEALDLLRLNGTPVAGLALIDSAAGFANAAGVNAISLVPTVAYIHYDATVVPSVAPSDGPRDFTLDPLPTPTPLPTLTPPPL